MIDVEDTRILGRTIYFEARRRGSEHYAALRTIPPMLERRNEQRLQQDLPPESVPDFETISEWADEHAWASQYQALVSDDFKQNLREPDDQESRFQKRLETARRMREMAALVLDRIHEELDEDDDDPAKISQDLQKRLQMAQSAYDQACRSEQRLEDEARKRLLEVPTGAVAAIAIRDREASLLAHYSDLPPVYKYLCGQLADLTYRAEQARTSGRDVSIDELAKLNNAILGTVAQIQRHTESTKSESLSKDRNELALAIMGIVERVVAPVQPNLWGAVFAAVKQELQAIDRGDRAELPPNVLALMPREAQTIPTEVPQEEEESV